MNCIKILEGYSIKNHAVNETLIGLCLFYIDLSFIPISFEVRYNIQIWLLNPEFRLQNSFVC